MRRALSYVFMDQAPITGINVLKAFYSMKHMRVHAISIGISLFVNLKKYRARRTCDENVG